MHGQLSHLSVLLLHMHAQTHTKRENNHWYL
jgi:hypothetical protein